MMTKEEMKKKVVEWFPKKKEDSVTIMNRKRWKKIAICAAAGVALVGTGIAVAIKLKNGDDISDNYESLIKNTDLGVCDPVNLSVFGDGVGYDAELLYKGDNVVYMGVESMSLQDVNKMLELINPDVYGISNQTNWDEIVFIQH